MVRALPRWASEEEMRRAEGPLGRDSGGRPDRCATKGVHNVYPAVASAELQTELPEKHPARISAGTKPERLEYPEGHVRDQRWKIDIAEGALHEESQGFSTRGDHRHS